MMNYQEPEMDVIEFTSNNVITDSNLYLPGDNTNTGGGTSEGGSWNDF